KIEAVRLLDLGKKSAVELALELGVRRNQLYKWKEQLSQKKEAAFRGPGRKSLSEESEVARLKRELEKVKEERDILKKAAACFARDLP
ncbi:MAG: transposase, partial [Alphaproteobacteria bacterium]